MSCESLIKMANQIAQYFASEPDHTLAVNGVRQHIKSFWTRACAGNWPSGRRNIRMQPSTHWWWRH